MSTGRLVGGEREGKRKPGGSPPGTAMMTMHWCPDAMKNGIEFWTCPDCGQRFQFLYHEKRWVPFDG
jgi:hypothetical protein